MMAAALAAGHALGTVQAHAALFKLDFGTVQNTAQGVTLTDWDTFDGWAFTGFPDGIATWNLTDFSADHNTNVTLTITDNAPLAAQLGAAPAWGMGGVSRTPAGLDVVYDGIPVPAVVKDDYMGRDGDFAGTEMLFRFANLSPGRYHVTVFDGRMSDDNGQYGKIWVDDINGKKEPADQNTGDFSATHLEGGIRVPDPQGNPQTISVDIRAGDYLWYAHMEDNQGGISGMIIRSVATLVDTDGDGLPDYWETQSGLDPNDPTDAAKDLNGNGISNLLEYQLGLNPADKTTPTILSAVANPISSEVTVTFSKPLFKGSAIAPDPRDATLATNRANYSISPALSITGVAVKGDVVTLTTGKPTRGTAYTLSVNNVRDVNNWPVAAKTQVAIFNLPAPVGPLAQTYRWITIAGEAGQSGSDDGTNNAARFNWPWGIALDSAGTIFIAGGNDHNIRQLKREGTNWVTTTIAGLGGQSGSDDGINSAARFNWPEGIAVDAAGHLYVADDGNSTIRMITPVGNDWVTTTIAGVAGSSGSTDGTNDAARFNGPADITLDKAGNLYVTDCFNDTIRKLTPAGADWVVTTIAGKAGNPGSTDGTNDVARFDLGTDANSCVVADNAGHLFVSDYANHTIRKITAEGTNWVTTTIAGKAGWPGVSEGVNSTARFYYPNGLALDAWGNLYESQLSSSIIRLLVPEGKDWVSTTVGGTLGRPGSADGTNSVARFYQLALLKVDSQGNIYLADAGNNTIRMGIPLLPVIRSVTLANGRIELTWSAAPGQTVQLQYSASVVSANWTNLGASRIATGGTMSASDTPGLGQPRFYRVVVLP